MSSGRCLKIAKLKTAMVLDSAKIAEGCAFLFMLDQSLIQWFLNAILVKKEDLILILSKKKGMSLKKLKFYNLRQLISSIDPLEKILLCQEEIYFAESAKINSKLCITTKQAMKKRIFWFNLFAQPADIHGQVMISPNGD